MLTKSLALVFSLFFTLVGCQRATKSSSQIVIQVPELIGKPAIFSAREICYAVSVTANDIPVFTNSCSPSTGIIAGFIASGQPLEIEVPTGLNRKIELFAFVKATGDTSPCPRFSNPVSPSMLYSIYRVGAANSVNLVNATETVSIEVRFPAITQHLVNQYKLPVSCAIGTAPSEPNLKGFYASSSQQTSSATGIKLTGRIGQPLPATEATDGTNYLLKGSVR